MIQHATRRMILLCLSMQIVALAAPAIAAETGAEAPHAPVRIDRLEILSRMQPGGAAPTLLSRADLDFVVSSPAPVTADAGVRVEHDDGSGPFSEDLAAGDAWLALRYARLRILEPAGAPLELAYFVGEPEVFASGREFPRRFGSEEFTTRYRGYLYFPAGPEFDGLRAVDGTGVSITTSPSLAENADLGVFMYQDAAHGPERYATDLRFRRYRPHFSLEMFAGATYPEGDYGLYRAGAMAYFSTPGPGSFFAQAGVLDWDPDDEIDLEDMYFLFEPRLRFSRVAMVYTFFSHPARYRGEETGTPNRMDISGRLQLEELAGGILTAGIESAVLLDPDASDKAITRTGPVVELEAGGVQWLMKLNVQAFPYEQLDGLEAVFAARTSF